MPNNYLYLNNQFIPEKEACISILDQAYLFGFGLFETICFENGQLQLFEEHYERFRNGAKKLGIKIPISKQKLKKIILECLEKNQLKQSSVKIQLSPKQKSLSDTKIIGENLLVITRDFPGFPKDYYNKGVKAWILDDIRIHHDALSSVKVLSYASMQYARNFAKSKKVFETILKDTNGNIAECSSSNIFIVNEENQILTPSLKGGILSGVTRKKIIQIAKENNIRIREVNINEDDLFTAREVFISSSLKHILPIRKINERKIGTGKCGPITKKLIAIYSKIHSK